MELSEAIVIETTTTVPVVKNKHLEDVLEAMVAGDAAGEPTDIAAGKRSGSITNKGPDVVGKKKRIKTYKEWKNGISGTKTASTK